MDDGYNHLRCYY